MPGAVANEMSGIEKAAVLMVSLGTAKSAEVFKHLDREQIKKLSAGIIALKHVDADTKATVLEEFARARALAARDLAPTRNYAAELVDSAIVVEQTPASFDDLAKLDGPAMEAVLAAVDHRTMCLALKAAGNDVKQAVFSNLTTLEAESLKREIEQIGAVKLRDIEEAQDRVAAIVGAEQRAARSEGRR